MGGGGLESTLQFAIKERKTNGSGPVAVAWVGMLSGSRDSIPDRFLHDEMCMT